MKSSVKFVSVDSICLQDERQTATQCGLDFQTLCIGALQGRGWGQKRTQLLRAVSIFCAWYWGIGFPKEFLRGKKKGYQVFMCIRVENNYERGFLFFMVCVRVCVCARMCGYVCRCWSVCREIMNKMFITPVRTHARTHTHFLFL